MEAITPIHAIICFDNEQKELSTSEVMKIFEEHVSYKK
jgi:hypothetical protein